jgi:hypothetical protein
VINYSYGRDLVGAYVDAVGGTDEAKRWADFAELPLSPTVPADLALPTAN